MQTKTWEEIAGRRFSPGAREQMKADARAELERVGLAALRKAREHTQAELGEEMGLPQASISDMERRADLLLSTLGKYIRALGGELEIRAVFPEATFHLETPALLSEGQATKSKATLSKVRKTSKKVA